MDTNKTSEKLRREMGPRSIALTSMNVMVGSGIFALPALVAEGLGATAIIAYGVCGILVFLLNLCFAEVGSRTNTSGGVYTYIEKAFGPFAGFLAANMYIFACMASDAAVANALADTLQYFTPTLRVEHNRIIFQLLIFGGLAWLNISSVKNGTRFIAFASLVKFIPLILLVCLAIPYVETQNLQWTTAPTVANIGPAALLLFFAFLGSETSLCNGGEIKNPARNVPLGLFAGISIVLLLYVSIQLVTQGTLGNNLSNYKEAPLAAVANIAMGKVGMVFIVIVTAFSILGTLSGEILCIPRIMFAAARNKQLPEIFAKVHPRFATPHIAIAVYAGIGFILAVSGGFKQLALFASIAILPIYFGVALSVIRLRKKSISTTISGFRLPGGPVIPVLAATTALWLFSNSSKKEMIALGIFMAVFSVIYFLMWRWRKVHR